MMRYNDEIIDEIIDDLQLAMMRKLTKLLDTCQMSYAYRYMLYTPSGHMRLRRFDPTCLLILAHQIPI